MKIYFFVARLLILKSQNLTHKRLRDFIKTTCANANLLFKKKMQGIETRLNAYGPLYVEKPPKYWLSLAESFIKARNATTAAPMF